jgi:hypothetical protein
MVLEKQFAQLLKLYTAQYRTFHNIRVKLAPQQSSNLQIGLLYVKLNSENNKVKIMHIIHILSFYFNIHNKCFIHLVMLVLLRIL